MTAEATASLEDVIRQRILDEAWDDPEPVASPTAEGRPEAPDLSAEKSNRGLAEVYEEEYQRRVQGVRGESESEKKEQEIDGLMTELFGKLDNLTNFYFTPEAPRPKPSGESAANVPSVAMEEITPLATSVEQSQAAPEEVHARGKGRAGVLVGGQELNPAEKQAQRRAAKVAKRKRQRQRSQEDRLVERMRPGLGNKYAKERVKEAMQARNVTEGTTSQSASTDFGKSAQFFAHLQASVRDEADKVRSKVRGAQQQPEPESAAGRLMRQGRPAAKKSKKRGGKSGGQAGALKL